MSAIYDLPNHHNHFSKEDPSKSFIIHRRPLNNNENNQFYGYKNNQDQQSIVSSKNDYQEIQRDRLNDDSDYEPKRNGFSATIFNNQTSAYYTPANQVF